MLHAEYQAITQWLHQNPQWGGVVAFLIAFTESLAIIGTIIPGSITMTAIGIMMGSNILPIESTLLLAILGALVGDSLSYVVGYTFRGRIQQMWPFTKHPGILNHGKNFFEQHGGKSVLLGRFVGPIRALIPLIAGILHMKPIRFFPYDIFAALIWAPLYLLPGFFIGVAAQSLPADIATQLILLVIAVLLAIWLFLWLLKTTSSYLKNLSNRYITFIWSKMIAKKQWHWLCRLIRNIHHPDDPGQLGLLFIIILASILLTLLFIDLHINGKVQQLNWFIYHLLRGFRTLALDKAMVIASAFGNRVVLLPVAGAVFFWLALTRRWHIAFHWAGAFILSIGISIFFREIFHFNRPPGIFFVKPTSSFPSGHVVLSATFYFLLAWMCSLRRPDWKKGLYYFASIILGFICLSRLYLQAHWLSDVIAGLLIAGMSISIIIISFNHRFSKTPHSAALLAFSLFSLFVSVGTYLAYNFQDDIQNSQMIWEERTIATNVWWSKVTPIVPTYRKNRLGHPVELLNVQWADNLDNIHQSLTDAGWHDIGSINGQLLIHQLLNKKNFHRIQLLPMLFEDQRPVINMVKQGDNDNLMIIRLWPANIRLLPQNIPLWVGTLNNEASEKSKLFHHTYTLITANDALAALASVLSSSDWRVVQDNRASIPYQLIPTPDVPAYKILLKGSNE